MTSQDVPCSLTSDLNHEQRRAYRHPNRKPALLSPLLELTCALSRSGSALVGTSYRLDTEIHLTRSSSVGTIYGYLLSQNPNVRITGIARSAADSFNEHGVDILSEKHGNVKGWRPYRVLKDAADAADRPYRYVPLQTSWRCSARCSGLAAHSACC